MYAMRVAANIVYVIGLNAVTDMMNDEIIKDAVTAVLDMLTTFRVVFTAISKCCGFIM